jgi:prevent-host-death family protein
MEMAMMNVMINQRIATNMDTATWTVAEAKAKLSAIIDKAIKTGRQTVTQHSHAPSSRGRRKGASGGRAARAIWHLLHTIAAAWVAFGTVVYDGRTARG